MNLTGQEVRKKEVPKKAAKRKRRNEPTLGQREMWERARALGCVVTGCYRQNIEIHHCETGMGRKKDHDRIIPLCKYHHRGEEGIGTISRRVWEGKYGSEASHMDYVRQRLGITKASSPPPTV